MKLVRESLNQFERGIDPKAALGVGIYATHDKEFNDADEWADFVISILPGILNTKEIHADIFGDDNAPYYIHPSYWSIITEHLNKYNISLKNTRGFYI